MRRLLGLGLLSGSGLLLEIELTRLFSTIYYPPYVYILLALALLGIGVGAALATLAQPLRTERQLPRYALLAALTTLAVTLAVLRWPSPAGQWLHLSLATLPFVATGLAMATIFSAQAHAAPRLYAADLFGAGVGALLAVPLIDALQLPNSLLLTALLFALVALLWSDAAPASSRNGARAAAGGLAILLLTAIVTGRLTLDVTKLAGDKPLVARLADGGTLVATVWDSFARTDLIDPGDGRPYELYMDGAAGSVMPPAGGDPALWRDIGLFPFATEQPARVFVIGPGGGLDVWFGLQSNATVIDGAEVNRASVEIVRDYAAYNGGLYDEPGVTLAVDEGRSVLARATRDYDLIFLAHVVTLAAERGGLALVENSAFTQEAFATYFDHLAPQGLLAVKLYDEPTLTRALATALMVLNRRGLSDAQALQHVIVLLDNQAEPPIPLLMVRNAPYAREDALAIGAVAREVGFTPLFLPGLLAEAPLDSVVAGEQSLADLFAGSANNLTPVTDDRPFFYQFDRGLPPELKRLLWALLAIVTIGGAGVVVFVRRISQAPERRVTPIYFAALGAGFMVIEIALMQQTRLYLGHPAVTAAVVLGVLLIGGGGGSLLFGRLTQDAAARIPQLPLAAIIGLTLVWLALWPLLQQATLAWPLPGRIGVVTLALVPLALCMGAPFPAGLRALAFAGAPADSQATNRLVALAWSVNGVMSVVGATAALALAIQFGYRSVLLTGAGLYGVAWVTAWWSAVSPTIEQPLLTSRPRQTE